MIKPGDRVEVISNKTSGWHPTMDRPLVSGDTIVVHSFDLNKNLLYYEVTRNDSTKFNSIYKDEAKELKTPLAEFEKNHNIKNVDIDGNIFEQLNWLSYEEVMEWFSLYKRQLNKKTSQKRSRFYGKIKK